VKSKALYLLPFMASKVPHIFAHLRLESASSGGSSREVLQAAGAGGSRTVKGTSDCARAVFM
jgi:hypothetical protein